MKPTTVATPIRSIESANQRTPIKAALMATRAVQTALIMALSVAPTQAQGTVMPIPLMQWLDNTGAVLNNGGLCVFAAGTTTLANTYTTAALTVANANPIRFDSAGRPTTGGVFLTPGTSYKFVLKSATVTTCNPDTGVSLWSVDNVSAVPGSSTSLDATGAVGETVAAGDIVFLSTGTGGLTAGQWYKADADFSYRSTAATLYGAAPNAITSGASGSIRLYGPITTTGLVTGSPYYISATAGGVTVTPPTNAVRIGQAQSATVLMVGGFAAPVGPRAPPCGRLTLTTGVPVTSADVTAATTLYYAPYLCNQLSVFDGTNWAAYAFAQLSIAVPATTNQMYDVFVYDNAGVLALELTAWTNDTTRATALTTQHGVYVKTGALTRLYLGSFRTTGVSGQTEDSLAKRLVWNYYNRLPRRLEKRESTASWAYTTAVWRQARGSTANQVEYVVGVAEVTVDLQLGVANGNASINVGTAIAIAQDSVTVPTAGGIGAERYTDGNVMAPLRSSLALMPAVGYHYAAWLEYSAATGSTNWYSSNFLTAAAGLSGSIDG